MIIAVDITGGTILVDDNIWFRYCMTQGNILHVTNHGYAAFRSQGIKLFHRWIFNYPSCYVGHLDANKLNNTSKNLYLCSQSENQKNLNDGVRSNNSTGVRGVTYNQRERKWKVEVSIDRKRIFVGTFDTLEKATAARKRAEDKYGYVPLVKQS